MKRIFYLFIFFLGVLLSTASCSPRMQQVKANTAVKVVIIPTDSVVTLMGRNFPPTNIWAAGH